MPTTVDIIDALAAPPFASLQQVLDTAGPYASGDHTRTTFTTNGAFLLPAGTYDVGGTYGVIVRASGTIPPDAGFKIGWSDPLSVYIENEYDDPICQIVQQHLLPITSAYVTTTIQWVNRLEAYIPWNVLLGSGARIGLHVEPNWAVDLYYMCVL